MLRRLLTASFVALLVAGVLPAGVLAAAPSATGQSVATDEDTPLAITLAGADGEGDPLTFAVIAGPAHGSLSGTEPNLTYTPVPNFYGTDSFTFTANDGSETSAPADISITVNPLNDPPVAADDPGTACLGTADFGGSFPIPEDWPGGGVGPDGWFAFVSHCAPMYNDVDPDGDELTFELVGTPEHGEAVILPDGFLAYDPDPDYSTPAGYEPGGTWLSDTIHYRVFDGSAFSDTASYRLWISPVNDAPTFTAGPDVSVDEDSGPYVGAWATAVSPGPGDSDQEVSFVVDAISNPTLFASAPSISSAGELSFDPAPDFSGQSTVTVHARDDGGLEDYDVAGVSPDDTSEPVVFTISIDGVNDAPAPVSFSATAQRGFQLLLGELAAYDIDGDDTTAFTVVTPPGHGSLEIPSPILCQGVLPRGCGTVVLYTADTGYVGPDSFTYTATDGLATSALATVTINVTDNAAPVCDNASSAGAEEAPQVGNLTCSDAENEDLTFSPVASATNGNVIVAPDGSWGYQPNANFSGADSFTFQAADANGVSNTATMSITVNGLNDAPVCTGFAPAAAAEETQQSGTITTCTDIETGVLTYSKVSDPLHGSATVSTDGTWTYTPAANYNGPDAFTFQANDGTVNSAPATVTITVTAVNDAPVATPQAVSTGEDNAKAITLAGTDIEGSPLTFTVVAGPAHGVLTGSAPDLTYTPAANYNGPDSFTFRSNDGTTDSSTATVSITVTALNDAPTAAPQSPSTNEDTAKAITLTGADVDLDTLTYAVVAGPAHGSLSGTAPDLTYTPAANYTGPDSFTFRANDGTVGSNTATVSITVTAVNDTPVCAGDATRGPEDTQQVGTISCSDVDGDPLTYSRVANAAHGTASVASNGAWTYTPAANWFGPDSFRFRASDGTANSNTATMAITVTEVNDAPVCSGTTLSTDKNVPVSGSVGCTDVDLDTLVLRIGTDAAKGTIAPFDTAGGAFTYTPDPDVIGSDAFTVIANDGTIDSAPATVDIGIANHAPVCSDAAPTAAGEDADQSGSLACVDDDLDDLSFSVVDQPAHGTVDLNPGTGAWTYTPALNWSGSDGFTFSASDGTANSNTATLSITVTAVNDAPVATLADFTMDEDKAQTITLAGADVDLDTLTYAVVTSPSHGTLSGTAPDLTYTPAANYNGTDGFTFKVNDGALDSDVATVSITVTDLNDLPSANSESSGFFGFPYVAATTTTRLNVLANDTSGPRIGGVTSEPADPITITAVSGAGRGTVSILPGGAALAYDPRGCLTGDDVFSYTVTDGHGETDPATVAVTVARPGAGGLGNAPITDVPSVGLRSGATIGRTVPVRVSWCGVVKSKSNIKGFRVEQSASAGASWPTLVTRSTTATSTSRSIGTSRTYAWRVRTTDTASRTGTYRASTTAKASIRQETPSTTVVYAGAWRTSSASSASGGRMRSASSTSASVTITVAAGTRQVGIVAPKGSAYGSFKVWVDGAYAGRFSERASASYRQILFVRSVNPGTAHTIVLKPAGTGRVYLDAIVTLQ